MYSKLDIPIQILFLNGEKSKIKIQHKTKFYDIEYPNDREYKRIGDISGTNRHIAIEILQKFIYSRLKNI